MGKKYRYETHLHTCEASKCGVTKGADYIKYFMDLGYDGIIVTDHFFNGNCGIDHNLPWEERVNQFCKGYEHAKEEGDKYGFNVMFGWEDNYECDEYLVYGLDKEWLLNHPDMLEWSHKEHIEQIHAGGGLVVQAHPFRERGYITNINLHPYHCDAIEVSNSGNPLEQDVLAYYYCQKLGLPMTAGSDIHVAAPDYRCFGVSFDEPLKDIHDYVNRIKSNAPHDIITEPERTSLPDGIESISKVQTHLPIYLHEYEKSKRIVTVPMIFDETFKF